jgi:hypothetical protein
VQRRAEESRAVQCPILEQSTFRGEKRRAEESGEKQSRYEQRRAE